MKALTKSTPGYQPPSWNMPEKFTLELDSYRDKGSHCQSKYLVVMHKKIHCLINEKVLKSINSSLIGKSPQVPTPDKYGGMEDTEEFKQWLSSFFWWL
jgi:hypothetical protein